MAGSDTPAPLATPTETIDTAVTATTSTNQTEPTEMPDSTSTPEPTATVAPTATPQPEPTPTTGAIGTGRSNPVPLGEVGQAGDWEIQVLEVVRGDDAYNRLIEANQFNDPAPQGMEYAVVNVRVKYNGS